MIKEEYFPLVIATGTKFCNRTKEKEYLKKNILSKRHTLLLAPRRYGKTSLILKVLEELDVPGNAIDFFAITDEQSVVNMLFNGVGQLLGSFLPAHKNILQKLHHLFAHLNPTVELSLAGQRVKFQIDAHASSPEDIILLLQGLDKLAVEEQKQVTLIMDEFQQLRTLKNAIALEGAIRHAVERSKNICYIFSGSTRNTLQKMFDDIERPLYRSCDKLILERIAKDEYNKFLTKMAKNRWNKALEPEVIENILDITQCHSYYVNALCSRLWQSDILPSLKEIHKEWSYLAQIEKAWIVHMMAELSTNQRAMMVELTRQPTQEPTGKAFLLRTRLSSASANQALKTLLEKDLIYLNKENYFRLVDPLVEFCLRQVIA